MLNRPTALLSVAATIVLASCAHFVPAVDQTAELYDMDSYLVARAHFTQAPPAALALPLPQVTEAAETAPQAARGASSADEAEPIGLPEVGIVIRPAAVTPESPVALPSPVPPAIRTPPAKLAAPPSSVAVPPASAGSAAKPAASTAAAVATAPAAPSTTAPAPAAPVSAQKAREVYARVGDEIEIGLDGVGFLFLGFADRETDSMTFKARAVKEGKTYFTFRALKLGTWNLDFQQQDNAAGRMRVESVRVIVLEEADFAAAVQRQTAQGGEPVLEEMEAGRFEWARKLEELGKESAAIAEYLKGYRDGNAELNDRIASLYTRTGDGAAAEKYWRKNVGAASPWGDRAVVGMARLAVARGDVDGYLAWHRQLLAVTSEPIDDVLVEAALAARATGDVGLGIDLLAEYGRRYPKGKRMDEAAFVTAQLLEADSPFRDLKRSRDLYAAVLREFPESALAPEAVERLRYLEQHFFTIR